MPDSQLESQIQWSSGASPQGQAPMSSVAGGNDLQGLLSNLGKQSSAINAELLKALPEALKQTAQKSTPAVAIPAQAQHGKLQMDQREPVSGTDARNKSIHNSLRQIGNVVSQSLQKRQEQKTKTLSIDIERILQAQDGMNEAQQVLKSDPNNAEAQQALAKNKDIINAVLSDDKKRKEIGKAFDINFLDPSKNNKPEHQALNAAVKSYADQLQDKTPTTLGPDKQAIAKVQLLDQQAKALDTMMKNTEQEIYKQDYLKQMQEREQGRNNRAEEQLDFKKQQEADKQAQFSVKLQEDWQKAKLSSDTRLKAAAISASSRLEVADKQIAGRMEAIQRVYKGGGGVKEIQALTSVVKMYQGKQKFISDEIAKTEELRVSADPSKVEEHNHYIQTLEDQKLQIEQAQEDLQQEIAVKTSALSAGDGNARDSGSSFTQSTSTRTSTKKSSSNYNGSESIPKPIASARPNGPAGDSDPDHF